MLKYFPEATILTTPNYWLSPEEMKQFTRKKRYNFNKFYQFQKSKFSMLLEKPNDFGILNSKSQDKLNRNRIEKP